MAESVGYATLDVIPSVKGLAKNLDKQVSGDLDRAGKRGGAKFGDSAGREAGKGFKSRLGEQLRGFNPLAGLAIGAGVATLFKSAVTEASEAEQAVGGVNAVFGKFAQQVIDYSRDSAENLGLSSAAYQQLVTVSGALLKNKGLEDFAAQSQNLVEIGADLAAMFGGSTLEAVEALNAAMRGESDPIERYAISINETAINARLAKDGLTGLKGAALEQAKAQARLALIQEQSADAQGAFARESDTFAGQTQRLAAEFADMRKELGQEFLPVLTAGVGFIREDAIPVLSEVGGVVKDGAEAFGALPGPVKAATAALLGLKAASSFGLTDSLLTGAASARGGMDSLRIRTMLAADAYRDARKASIDFTGSSAQFNRGAGRMSAGLTAIKTGADGAEKGMKSVGKAVAAAGGLALASSGLAEETGLANSASLALIGTIAGPWGAAIGAGAGFMADFAAKNDDATAAMKALQKQAKGAKTISSMGASLDEAKAKLAEFQESMVSDGWNDLDAQMTRAADKWEGLWGDSNTDELRHQMTEIEDQIFDTEKNAAKLAAALQFDSVNKRVITPDWFGSGLEKDFVTYTASSKDMEKAFTEAQAAMERLGITDPFEQLSDSQLRSIAADVRSANTKITDSYAEYGTAIEKARGKLVKLMEKENERRQKNLGDFNAQTRLAAALDAANKEAKDGARTLDEGTEAGRENRDALAAVAEAWNSTSNKIKRAKGAYEEMRQKFIKIAEEMTGSKKKAKDLADELLGLPKKPKGGKYKVPGLAEARAEAQHLRNLLDAATSRSSSLDNLARHGKDLPKFATGGLIQGPGTGTSDSILARVSDGEHITRKAAVDYYGADFMARLNKMQVPKFATGGLVSAQPAPARATVGTTIQIEQLVAHDYDDFLVQAQRRKQAASLGGFA